MYGHPVARKMEKWWKTNAANPESEEWKSWIETFKEFIDVKYTEMTEAHSNVNPEGTKLYGMASAGGCTRKNTLKLLGYPEEDFSGSSQFTFFLGHVVEIAALATLHHSGYPILETQIPVEFGKMYSYGDGLIELLGRKTMVSVKSTAYKMSSQRKGKWYRRGFAQLPFEGTYNTNPSHWVQMQAELAATGYSQGLMLYVSKDIVQVFEKDEYLGENGNGSLTFYAELITSDKEAQQMILDTYDKQYEYAMRGEGGPPLVFTTKTGGYIELPEPAKVLESNKWGGKNQDATGTFNPCGGCNFIESCKIAP